MRYFMSILIDLLSPRGASYRNNAIGRTRDAQTAFRNRLSATESFRKSNIEVVYVVSSKSNTLILCCSGTPERVLRASVKEPANANYTLLSRMHRVRLMRSLRDQS